MKFSKGIKVKNGEDVLSIEIRCNTTGYAAWKAKERFANLIDKITEALQDRYHFEEIRIK